MVDVSYCVYIEKSHPNSSHSDQETLRAKLEQRRVKKSEEKLEIAKDLKCVFLRTRSIFHQRHRFLQSFTNKKGISSNSQ